MVFKVILHDLDKRRIDVVKDIDSLIGFIRAESEIEAAEKCGLIYKDDADKDNDQSCRYMYPQFPDVEIQFQAVHKDLLFLCEEDLFLRIKELMDYRNEIYSMYS